MPLYLVLNVGARGDHKAYGQGDDPKHIDWRVLARTDKYYVKRFEDETNLRVYLAVDRSASMDYGSGEITKYQYACHLAAALGYVIVKARDSVGLVLHSDKVDERMGARNSFAHLNNMLKVLQNTTPAKETNIADALHEIAGSVRRRALVVVISDLLGDEEAIAVALAHLRKQRHDVIVLQVLDPVEIDLSLKHACELTDLETHDRMQVNPRGLAESYKNPAIAKICNAEAGHFGRKIRVHDWVRGSLTGYWLAAAGYMTNSGNPRKRFAS